MTGIPCSRGGRDDRVHVGDQPIEMHRHDGLGSRRDGGANRAGIDVEGHRVDVDEPRRRADARDAAGGGEEREGRGDDFVAGADRRAPSASRGSHRCPTTWRPRRVDADLPRQLALERVDLGAEDEALAVADARDGGEDLLADRPVLRLEIEERDHCHCAVFTSR